MEDNRSLDEIYDAICKRIQERYSERGEKISDDESRKTARNWIGFCEKLIETDSTKEG